jgi:chromosomal replication initiator protein
MRHNRVFAAIEAVDPNIATVFEGPVRKALQLEFGAEEYSSWLQELRLVGQLNGDWVFAAPRGVVRDWVELRAAHRLEALMANAGAPEGHVRIVVEDDLRDTLNALIQPGANVTPLRPKAPDALEAPEPAGGGGFTFENFCAGASNRAAINVAKAIAQGSATAFPIVLIHGPPGVGKTHLLSAIAAEIAVRQPRRRVRYMMAPIFIQEFQDALAKKRDMSAFKAMVRENDIFLFDDVHRLAGKRVTEEEFLDSIALIMSLGGQVVISADHGPQGLDGFDERLRNTLRGAADVAIQEPDFELRRRIVDMRVKAHQSAHPDFTLSDPVLDLVAGRIAPSGRELDGAVQQLLLCWLDHQDEITPALATTWLQHKFAAPQARVSVEQIIKAVAKYYQMTGPELLQKTRQQAIARPRQIAMHLATKMTTRSLPYIAKRFGGYDHTTVLYARDRIADMSGKDPSFAAEVDAVAKAVRDGMI